MLLDKINDCTIEGVRWMTWNLFWSLFIGAFALVCWVVFYYFGLRKRNKEERCVSHTIGTVIRYSSINYGGINLPLVSYQVNGKDYRITGPKFRSSWVRTTSVPTGNAESVIETNLTTREELPDVLRATFKQNSFISVHRSPLEALYPVGSEVDVYYNPRKPKEAFVQRYEGHSNVLYIITLCSAIILSIAAIYILFGPEIVMK